MNIHHDCPVSDRACPISPTTSKILIQKLDFLKSSQLFYLWTKKNKNIGSKVICDTHLKPKIFNKNRVKHEKKRKQIFCPC